MRFNSMLCAKAYPKESMIILENSFDPHFPTPNLGWGILGNCMAQDSLRYDVLGGLNLK